MADSTLGAIRTKVRRLTRSPSAAQLSDALIDEYVNTFILYDFPVSLRLFSLRTTLTFYTQPYVDRYDTNTVDPLHPLYNFKNRFTTIHQPIYIAGVQGFFTQFRNTFYASWPQTASIQDTGLRGTGAVGPYAGTLATGTVSSVMQNNVIFTALDANGTAMVLVDYPVSNVLGALGLPGQPQVIPSPYGQINYQSGAYTATFPNAVALAAVIKSETVPYQPAKPIGMLYYDDTFILRPVPDMAYAVTIEADARPTELLLAGQIPDEAIWWQYVAIGAAIKVFQDRMDMDSVQTLWPEFARQEDIVRRPTIDQMANERTKTLYTQGKTYGSGWFLSNWPY